MKLLATILISFSLLASASAQTNQAGASSATAQESQMIRITRRGSQPSRQGPAENFTGSVRVDPLFQANAPLRAAGALVTFEPGAHTAWHTHPLGQILIVTAGAGRLQRWGDPVDEIRQGDVVWIPPGQKHWHGAAPDSSMAHIAISEALDGKSADWMEKVSDAQYRAPVRAQGPATPAPGVRQEELVETITDTMKAQTNLAENGTLNAKQQSIVTISAFTAKGDLKKLHNALNAGLDSGLTVNESKEVLVQLYAYCGFPRSLQGINTFISVLEERKKKGIKDEVGRDAAPITNTGSKYERGKKNLEKLTGRPESQQKTGYAAFSPEIEVFLKEHLFADIFERDVLNFTDREIATISALISLGGVEPMMQGHMAIGLNVGISESGLKQILSIIESNLGKKDADAGRKVLSGIIAARNK